MRYDGTRVKTLLINSILASRLDAELRLKGNYMHLFTEADSRAFWEIQEVTNWIRIRSS